MRPSVAQHSKQYMWPSNRCSASDKARKSSRHNNIKNNFRLSVRLGAGRRDANSRSISASHRERLSAGHQLINTARSPEGQKCWYRQSSLYSQQSRKNVGKIK